MIEVMNAERGLLRFASGPEDIRWTDEARERGFVEVPKPCHRCGGAGGADAWRYTGWVCYACGGNGVSSKLRKIYTPERRAELDAINEKRAARKAAKEKAEREAEAEARKSSEHPLKAEHPEAFEVLEPVIEKIWDAGIEHGWSKAADKVAEDKALCPFVVDVAAKWAVGFKVTGKMLAAVPDAAAKWTAAAERKAAAEAAEADRVERAVPVAEISGKGIDLAGVILGVKEKENAYGSATKMLFEDDRGFRLWGTVAAPLVKVLVDEGMIEWDREAGYDGDWVLKADRPRVEFVANVSPSDDDELFGFFNRPRRAELAPAPANPEGN